MTETIITVQGTARSELAPEQALVRFMVSADGPERVPVVAAVTERLADIATDVEALLDPVAGPVTRWSVDQVVVTAHRPWTSDGSPAALVHQASVAGRATVTDVDALSRIVEALSMRELVTIDALQWSVTDTRLEAEHCEVRARAVAEARAKAEVLATAAGLSTLTPLALADPGMLDGSGGGVVPFPRMERATMMAAEASGPPGLSLRPEPIVVEVAVDARFSAR